MFDEMSQLRRNITLWCTGSIGSLKMFKTTTLSESDVAAELSTTVDVFMSLCSR
jgi:hypothetical protein